MSNFTSSKHFLGQKSPWTKVCLENCPLDKSPLDNSLLGLSPLGQLLQNRVLKTPPVAYRVKGVGWWRAEIFNGLDYD